ncbi:MAG: NHL repeat-containing protein [Verrucomicrobia bacterium]|nr:NHL repeat-containing protein [Verrucomicrobiota bacterium]
MALTAARPLRADPILYVSDFGIGYSRIQQFDTNGAPSPFADTTAPGFAQSLAVDGAGNVYASSGGSVRRYAPDGTDLGVFVTNDLRTLAFDKSGNLCGSTGSALFKVSPGGAVTPFATTTNGTPVAMAVDNLGNVYAANDSSHSVQRFASNGADLGTFADTGALAHPTGMTIDRANHVFVAVGDAQGVYKFDTNGFFLALFANGNLPGTPTAMAIDAADNIYIQGQDTFHSISRYAPDETRKFLVGGGLGSRGFLAISEVPEPGTVALLGMAGGAGLLWRRRANALARRNPTS